MFKLSQDAIEFAQNEILSGSINFKDLECIKGKPQIVQKLVKSINKILIWFQKFIVNPIRILFIGIFPSLKKTVNWVRIGYVLLIMMLLAIILYGGGEDPRGLPHIFVIAFAMIALSPPPTRLVEHGVDTDCLGNIKEYIGVRFTSVKEVELFEENLKKYAEYVRGRVISYNTIVTVVWAILIYSSTVVIGVIPESHIGDLIQGLLKILPPAIIVVFGAILFLIGSTSYKVGTQKVIKTIEFACVDVKHGLHKKEEEEQLRLQQEQLQLLREIRDQSRFSALDELVASGKGFLSRVFQTEKVH